VTGRQTRYAEIADFLRGLVAESVPGDRLPSDTELAAKFAVSRMTARHAVQVLEREGLLKREQGRGTFVTPRTVPRLLGSPLSFTTSMLARGLTTTSKILGVTVEPPAAEDVAALGLDPGKQVQVLTRLRLADDVPMAIERAVLAPDVAAVVESIAGHSLHQQFIAIGRIPTWARSRVSARLATSQERRLLDLSARGVILNENRIIYDQDDKPLEHTDTWYAAERYTFTTVMTAEGRE
jgi:GntR family transcriptional regulator